MIDWKPVYGSSNVQAIAYDEAKQECYVKFHPAGAVYVYEGVGPGMWHELLHADSKGRFVQIQLRRAHPYRRVQDGTEADSDRPVPTRPPE